jgi:hypothetical protein
VRFNTGDDMARTDKYQQANYLLNDANRPVFERTIRKILSDPKIAAKSPNAKVDAAARLFVGKVKASGLELTVVGVKEAILTLLESE